MNKSKTSKHAAKKSTTFNKAMKELDLENFKAKFKKKFPSNLRRGRT
jgi:hypothetical protein